MSKQANNGKAFEWVVGKEFENQTTFVMHASEYANQALTAFEALSEKKKQQLKNSAHIVVKHIVAKEHVFFNSVQDGRISFNSDIAGQKGDVRDVVLTAGNRSLGVSCKHNHEALKHSRLSATIDFIKKWGIDAQGCSAHYWQIVCPLFDELKQIQDSSGRKKLWNELENKAERFYWPLLDAWADEIKRLSDVSPQKEVESCRAIISYLIGKQDFYKVICEGAKLIHIQAYNFHGTLATKRTKYPDSILAINNKNGGQYSKTLTFNHGYSLNFRIHSASSRVEPSLKFDINAIGLPTSEVYQQTLDVPS